MAKKKIKKIEKVEKPIVETRSGIEKVSNEQAIMTIAGQVAGLNDFVVKLEQRIDRIVTAISKAKSVKGL